MFIEDVITKIREPYTVQFNKVFKQANQMETEELYPSVLKDIEGLCKQLPYPPDEKLALRDSAFATTGCPHWINNYHFAGCTMCNYFAFHIDYLAKMKTLRDRDVRLYAKAVRYSLDLQIGKAPESFFAELITANDTLNPEEFPDEAFEEVFSRDNLFKTPPSVYIIETRAGTINPGRLRKWKKALGENLLFELGVEVGDQWIRNHWINKNMTNHQFEKAIETIKSEGLRFNANLLIGIPGLTDEQSRVLFYKSVDWLENLGVVNFTCSPLTRIEKTLQGFLYEQLQDNKKLVEWGVVNGKQTGIPWIFTIIESLYDVYHEKPHLINTLSLTFISFFRYLKSILGAWKHTNMYQRIFHIADILREFNNTRELGILKKTIDNLNDDSYYRHYKEWLKAQKGFDDLPETIYGVGEEIARQLWPKNWKMKAREFQKELDSFDNRSQPKEKGLKN